MLVEQLLDLRHVRATVDAVDHALIDHEHERRNLFDAELCEQARMLVCIDAPDTEAIALLPLNVREEALHAARRP